ncbi:AAA family ATPase [Okibacterium fritillariae]|uniref:AAA family ATPase n=1 Tax=Okibacterium fritillariae TaxID=123320 RepID=UPI0040555D0A
MTTAEPLPDSVETKPDYNITIRNCNSIEEASIVLRPGALNIKYGPNGIGKSTIAKALRYRAEGEGKLDQLTPFKHRADKDGPRPEVTGADDISQVMTFDDAYVSGFVFKRDEVLENSFEVFIKTEGFQDGIDQIASRFESLKQTFDEEVEFNEAVESFSELRDAFNVTKSGAVAKTSKGYKALTVGGKLENVPQHLHGFTNFIQSDNPATWITWQAKGKEFLELSDHCPFCSGESIDKETAKKVSEEYDSTAVRNMSLLRGVIERLGGYFTPSALQSLKDVTGSISGVSAEQESFVVSLRGQIETLLLKLSAIRALSFHALREEENLSLALKNLKIDLQFLPALSSEKTTSVAMIINGKLDEVSAQVGEIQGRINRQKHRVAKLIEKNQEEVNSFLRSAGYRYQVRIEPSDETYRMLLDHMDAPGDHIQEAGSHLSYGEKNAFAMVLFMHDVQHKKPHLVVLDDPVSSFDKTKKFAIINQLFRGRNSLRDTTTLLLTHDIEPAIDMVRVATKGLFTAAKPVAHFLRGSKGRVSEKPIEARHLLTFTTVCEENIKSASDSMVKCIYLRRLYEVHGTKDAGYELLSNLFHGREVPIFRPSDGPDVPLTPKQTADATTEIQRHISDFDYAALLAELKAEGALKARFEATNVGYEKVQLFRMMADLNPDLPKGDDVFTKFVNTTYHIENEYVLQLNPRDFDAVPEFVVNRCTELIAATS